MFIIHALYTSTKRFDRKEEEKFIVLNTKHRFLNNPFPKHVIMLFKKRTN